MSVEEYRNGAIKIYDSDIDPVDSVMSTGEWFVALLALSVPLLNVILLLIWAFGPGNRNRANYCRAVLAFIAVGFGLVLCSMLVAPR